MEIKTTKPLGAQTPSLHVSFDPLLKDKEAAPLLNISVPTFRRRVADGTIPKPIKLGGLSRWTQSEILAVIERAKAARDAVV